MHFIDSLTTKDEQVQNGNDFKDFTLFSVGMLLLAVDVDGTSFWILALKFVISGCCEIGSPLFWSKISLHYITMRTKMYCSSVLINFKYSFITSR